MGRLIDSNDLRKAMTWDNDLTEDDVQFILDKCPTAYDVDKVVEQITDCKKGIDNAISDDEFFRSGVKSGLTMAVEIVKKGGIE